MALEWVVLSYAAAAEAAMLLLITLPIPHRLRRGPTAVVRSAIRPLLAVVPFSLFLLMDIYWKHQTPPSCHPTHGCTQSELLRHQRSVVKCQRNTLLVATALLLYWLLFSVAALVARIDLLEQRLEKLRKED